MPCPCPRLAISNLLLLIFLPSSPTPTLFYSSSDSLLGNVRFMVHVYKTVIKGGDDDDVTLKSHMSKLGIVHKFIDIPMASSPSPNILE
jgi:hypothetical protein